MNHYINGLNHELPHPFRKRAEEAKKSWSEKARVDENGVVTWADNGNVPPKDLLEFWQHLGYQFNMEKTLVESKRQLKRIIENYKKDYNGPGEDEKAEARAAHGPGVKLKNAITGEEWFT